MAEKSNQTVLQIIQEMVRNNEPEEKIVKTLSDLGVTQEQAKRLLLIAEADTFSLISAELTKMVRAETELRQKELEARSEEFVTRILREQQASANVDFAKEMEKYKAEVTRLQRDFQESVSDSVAKVAKLNEEGFLLSKENKKMIDTVQRDLTETKLKGIKVRRSIARNIILGAGVVALLGTAYLIYMAFNGGFTIDYLSGGIVLALVGVAFVYLSTNL